MPRQKYSGVGVNDNDILFTIDDKDAQFDTFMLMTTAGAVDVFVSLDGTNYTTAALSLTDLGATDNSTDVLLTTAGRMYAFRGLYAKIRVLQNGATAATAKLIAGIGS